MTKFKTLLMTAALLAAPSIAFAQVDALTDAAKDKAVDTVLDNATTDDAIIAGKTMLKGGSKEDAAVAVVKNRVNDKVETMTDGVRLEEVSKDGVMDAGKDIAINKAKGSATTYTDGAAVSGVSKDGVIDAGKDIAMEKAKGAAVTYSDGAKTHGNSYGMSAADKAKSLLTTGAAPVIPKSGVTTPSVTTTTAPAPVATLAPINCPAGTKDAGDGTCMITGDWKP